ncbi:hypothetical protein AAVH_30912 [Aphelenchoides avenae]|nr:hypothetical protein AAVH_30912 [Aphelenchus avenae]
MAANTLMTTSTPELIGVRVPTDGGPAVRVRVSLVVMNDPIVRSTGTGTRLCELDCQNDDEERVRITAWREYADQLAESVKKGNLVQFTGLSAKKFWNTRFAYGALPYSLHFSNGSNFTVVDDNYRLAGMQVTPLEDLEADIEFLRNNLVDPRVRIRRVKARVSSSGLAPFCQGVIGTVLAYDQHDRSKTLSLNLQIEFVPADKRKTLVAGMLLDMRGMVALPQREGDPVEFRVVSFSDVDLRDNGLGPWLDSTKCRESTANVSVGGEVKKTTAVVVPKGQNDRSAEQVPLKGSTLSPFAPQLSTLVDASGSELTLLKGIVMDDFAAEPGEGVYVGPVYVKELRSDVTVSVHGATKAVASAFKEGRMVEMRGVLYEEGGQKRIDVVWPQIARSGKLPALRVSSHQMPPPVSRARAVDLRSASSSLQLVTGKVVAEGEQRGVHACFDVFVKDTSGKCAITVAVIGDLRDVQTSEMLEKEVDFKGRMQENPAGELEFIVAGWADVIPCSVGENNGVPESPSIATLNQNFDFMSTDSPPAKFTAKVPLRESSTAAVAAEDHDEDVSILDSQGGPSSTTVSLKQEKVVDVATDPSFAMLQSGGGQMQVKNRRQSGGAFQRPAIPAARPRSTRKSAPTDSCLVETPSKKPKPASSAKGNSRRGSTWLQDLKNLQQNVGDGNAAGDVSGEDSLSSSNTFNDALSNMSTASSCTGTGRVDFSAFVDDEAKEVNDGQDDGGEQAGESDGLCR